jgi:hypothetical protein
MLRAAANFVVDPLGSTFSGIVSAFNAFMPTSKTADDKKQDVNLDGANYTFVKRPFEDLTRKVGEFTVKLDGDAQNITQGTRFTSIASLMAVRRSSEATATITNAAQWRAIGAIMISLGRKRGEVISTIDETRFLVHSTSKAADGTADLANMDFGIVFSSDGNRIRFITKEDPFTTNGSKREASGQLKQLTVFLLRRMMEATQILQEKIAQNTVVREGSQGLSADQMEVLTNAVRRDISEVTVGDVFGEAAATRAGFKASSPALDAMEAEGGAARSRRALAYLKQGGPSSTPAIFRTGKATCPPGQSPMPQNAGVLDILAMLAGTPAFALTADGSVCIVDSIGAASNALAAKMKVQRDQVKETRQRSVQNARTAAIMGLFSKVMEELPGALDEEHAVKADEEEEEHDAAAGAGNDDDDEDDDFEDGDEDDDVEEEDGDDGEEEDEDEDDGLDF